MNEERFYSGLVGFLLGLAVWSVVFLAPLHP